MKTFKVADSAPARSTKKPVLIHPLTGAEYELGSLADTDFDDIEWHRLRAPPELQMQHRKAKRGDWRRTLLAFWRFRPEVREAEGAGKIGALWRLLPADTRVPDRRRLEPSGPRFRVRRRLYEGRRRRPALLTVSLGPVQGFIGAARSTSDLWAGWRLLARLAWEAMKPVCEALGPERDLGSAPARPLGRPVAVARLRDGQGAVRGMRMAPRLSRRRQSAVFRLAAKPIRRRRAALASRGAGPAGEEGRA